MSEDEPKTALLVVGNPIVEGQLKRVLHKRGYTSEISGDGDSAVDQYVQLKPDLVFIALDIPALDGHLAALEMRESDRKARIIFVSSKGRLARAEDAAYSSGAVGTLVTPIIDSIVEEAWGSWMGKIPEAPGLSDLDALYPVLEEKEPEFPPPLPGLPPLPGPLPGMPPVPESPDEVELPSLTSPMAEAPLPVKKKRWGLRIILLLALVGAGVAGAHYAELIDLSPYLDDIRESLGIT